jgi:hypothetical protein
VRREILRDRLESIGRQFGAVDLGPDMVQARRRLGLGDFDERPFGQAEIFRVATIRRAPVEISMRARAMNSWAR